LAEWSSRFSSLIEHDLFGKPLHTFPDHALAFLRHPPVSEIAMGRALHDGLRARELDLAAKSSGRIEVRAADQQEAELRLTQFAIELA
jgi:hypothetical protein